MGGGEGEREESESAGGRSRACALRLANCDGNDDSRAVIKDGQVEERRR